MPALPSEVSAPATFGAMTLRPVPASVTTVLITFASCPTIFVRDCKRQLLGADAKIAKPVANVHRG
jgi:hypothetical protein